MVVVDATMRVNGGYAPHLIYADSTDRIPLGQTWGPTLAEAQAEAVNYNVSFLSLTECDMEDIIASRWALASIKRTWPKNCDGDWCQRHDCELHYMDAPLKVNGVVRDGEQAVGRQRAHQYSSGFNVRFATPQLPPREYLD